MRLEEVVSAGREFRSHNCIRSIAASDATDPLFTAERRPLDGALFVLRHPRGALDENPPRMTLCVRFCMPPRIRAGAGLRVTPRWQLAQHRPPPWSTRVMGARATRESLAIALLAHFYAMYLFLVVSSVPQCPRTPPPGIRQARTYPLRQLLGVSRGRRARRSGVPMALA